MRLTGDCRTHIECSGISAMTNTSIKPRVTLRAEDTRRKIYEAAMQMFREKGFDETTMRDIAAKAGVALGGTYYYYSSKDAIVLAFYREMQESSTPLVGAALADKKKLKDRIRAALERHAPDSSDPLSPFSEETQLIRNAAIEQMRLALEGGDVKIPPDLKPRLPYLLWLYQMALIMFWLYDHSPEQEKTKRLMDKSLGLLVNLLRISSLPLMKPMRKAALELVETATV